MKGALKQVFRPTWMNVIKIVSLTLGFAVSVALMCRIAWYQSFDNFWEDVDNLKILELNVSQVNSGEIDFRWATFSALAPYIAARIPSVESATRFRFEFRNYLVNENCYNFHNCFVDDSFFDVLQIEMITGSVPKEILKNRGHAIISEKTAQILFPDGNSLGQVIKNETDIYTISGIFKDIPENSFIPEIHIISEEDILDSFTGDRYNWFTLLRTHKNTNLKTLNQEVCELLDPIYKDAPSTFGVQVSFRVTNIHDFSKREYADVLSWIVVFVLLLITGLNFALIIISSLVSRAKEVGVRKAAGARGYSIFLLIIWETAIYVLVAALVAGVMLWSLQAQLDEMFDKFENIFAFENLWGVAVVIGALIVIAGVLPAWIFSRIPVTQVFQRFVSNRFYWKRMLLFLQFTASIFVISFMFIFLKRYQTSVNHNYGYESDQLIWVQIEHPNDILLQTFIAEIGSDHRVEAISVSNHLVLYGIPGTNIVRNLEEIEMLDVRYMSTDSNFFKVHGIKILQGNCNLTGNKSNAGNVVVNQALLDKLQITGNPLGEVFYHLQIQDTHFEKIPFTITGVCQNFESLQNGLDPMVVMANDSTEISRVFVRVNEVTNDILKMLREKVIQYYPEDVPNVNSYTDTTFWYFHRLRLGGNIAIFATICLLLITIMGILGYVNLEIRRRTKEIAIRKIHGSTAIEVIWKISRELLLMALLATPIAVTLAWLFASRWQQDFVIKAELSWYLFAGAAFIVVLTIAICATLQTWRTASANPARALSSE